MSIIRHMIDIIRIRRLLQVIDAQGPLAYSKKDTREVFVAKYKKYAHGRMFEEILEMAEGEKYVKVESYDFTDHRGHKSPHVEYLKITPVKGRKLLNIFGFIEAVLDNYSKTANFISGGLFLLFIGLVIGGLTALVKWIFSLL